MDIKTPEMRSKNMAAIKGCNTKPEVIFRKALFKLGLRYRIQYRIKGKPDIVFPKEKIAVFVDGCFWHGCPQCYKEPKSNSVFWRNKINANITRDIQVNEGLRKMGWIVIRIWEHQIEKDLETVSRLVASTVCRVRSTVLAH